jgi:hypothetical protein
LLGQRGSPTDYNLTAAASGDEQRWWISIRAALRNNLAVASSELGWQRSIDFLRSLDRVPAALANADLLSDAQPRWGERVVARTSMHDLLFTRRGDEYPFPVTVRVSVDADVYKFELRRDWLLVTADRARQENALIVLDAFLIQLDPGS